MGPLTQKEKLLILFIYTIKQRITQIVLSDIQLQEGMNTLFFHTQEDCTIPFENDGKLDFLCEGLIVSTPQLSVQNGLQQPHPS